MKKTLLLGAVVATLLAGCAQTAATVEYIDENAPVCAQMDDGSKQTFPSMKELDGYSGASFLHEGPCYE